MPCFIDPATAILRVSNGATLRGRGRRSGPGAVALVTVCCLLYAPPVMAGEPSGPRLLDAIVASVDAEPITLRELHLFSRAGALLLVPSERSDRGEILNTLIMSRLYQAESKRYGITADDEDVNTYIKRILAQNSSSKQQVLAALDKVGLGWNVYFERMREEVQKLALINREIRSRVNVTPEEVERAWKENPEYDLPDRVEIAHIYIPLPEQDDEQALAQVQKEAEDAYREAKRKGFEETARAYSQGPTAAEGGRLGVFERGTMAPEYEKAVASLEEGQLSKPFQASGAFHIVKLLRVLPAGRVPLEQVADKIRNKLYDELLDARFKRWVVEDLRKRHRVTEQLAELEGLAAK